MTYDEQLQDPRWREFSNLIIIRAKLTCQLCGYESPILKRMVVHHKRYIKGLMAWEYDIDDVMCLCKLCHYKVHNSLIQERKVEESRIGNIIKRFLK
jgi:5-methylcytosine-specific restriction endonuclease McrA